MSVLWSYFWPILMGGVIAGGIAEWIALRHKHKATVMFIGFALALATMAAWHGMFGAADRLESQIDRQARDMLDQLEMKQVQAVLHQDPLSRRLLLSGPADDFQRSELSRILDELPGVRGATWSRNGGLPLIAEGTIAALAGFLAGAILAYLIELRRRYNSQWTW